MADYKLLSAVLADYADKAGTAESADTATTATTAETATKLSAGTVGSAVMPVYFSNGVPVPATGASREVSYTTKTLESGTTTFDILETMKYPMFWGSAETQDGQVRVYFSGTISYGEHDGYLICGTFYDYESGTVVSGFWTPEEFDDYVGELLSNYSDIYPFAFRYFA